MTDFENMPRIDELPEQTEPTDLTEPEVDDLLNRVASINEYIGDKQRILDGFTAHYQSKIERAQEIYEEETSYARRELALLTDRLDSWARKHITGRKRSLVLPSGTLKLTKQTAKFFVNGEPAANTNRELIDIARRVDSSLVKTTVTETADWAKFKTRLTTDDDGNVYLKDTGETVAGLYAEVQPDKFTMEITP